MQHMYKHLFIYNSIKEKSKEDELINNFAKDMYQLSSNSNNYCGEKESNIESL